MMRRSLTARDELAVGALARALVRTGMYVDAGIDTSPGLDNPRTYAAAILTDPELAADGLNFVMVESLLVEGQMAAQTERYANGGNLAPSDDPGWHTRGCAQHVHPTQRDPNAIAICTCGRTGWRATSQEPSS